MQDLVESTWRWRDAGTPMRRRRRIVSGEIMEFLDFSGASGKWWQLSPQLGVRGGGRTERRPVDDASGSRFARGRGRGPGTHDALADVGRGLGAPGADCPARG